MPPSAYELRARDDIRRWRNPPRSWVRRVGGVIGKPLSLAGDAVLAVPYAGEAIRRAVAGLLDLTNDAAQSTVRPGAIFEDFRDRGCAEIRSHRDLLTLDLEQVDGAIGWLAAKYKALAFTEGAGFGALGPLGIAPDVVALVTLNLRAVGEYAAYCGFDSALQHERTYAIGVLGFVASPDDSARVVAAGELARIAHGVARGQTWRELERHGLVRVAQRIAKALGLRLTKAKLAQLLPIAGAVVAGGFNTHFTSGVCDAAFHLYRERFLIAKYGEDFMEG
jgi:hypothetical protein